MSLRLGGRNPLSYKGVEPLQPPELVTDNRDPISGAVPNADYRNFNLGTLWLNTLNFNIWMLVNKALNVPTWILIGITPASLLEHFTTDDGLIVNPLLLNVNVFGDGINIFTNGATPNTVRISLNPNIIVNSVTTNLLTVNNNATFLGNIFTPLPRGVVQSPGGGGPLFSDEGTAGQILISSNAGAPAWANITSSDASITVTNGNNTIDITTAGGGGGTLSTLTGNVGVAIPVANNINVVTANATVIFVGLGNNLTLDFNRTTNLILGNSAVSLTTASFNVGIGGLVFNALTTGSSNVAIGPQALSNITSGSGNFALGVSAAGLALTTGSNNVAIGVGAMQNKNANNTIAIGFAAMPGGTGDNNIGIGTTSIGSLYVGTEANNILIQAQGVAGDNNTMRLGTQGAGAEQINKTFIAGITGIAVANLEMVTINTVTGQLGSQGVSATIVISQTIPGSYTWTKNANTKTVAVFGVSGGCGGGSGRRGTSTNAGGGGGGGCGSSFYYTIPASFLGASETYVVGSGGVGGAPQTVNNTDGNAGSPGTISSFGNIKPTIFGNAIGSGGVAASTPSATNGFVYSAYTDAMTAASSAGAGTNTIGAAASTLNIPYLRGSGGGGGSGADAGTPRLAGAGGAVVSIDLSTIISAGGTGGIEGGTINGGAGNVSITTGGPFVAGTGGGGGGGQSVGIVAGDGGAGGLAGGGGGGGGGSLNGTNSGRGGPGGNGLIIIIEYL